jgi:hypothetical protein
VRDEFLPESVTRLSKCEDSLGRLHIEIARHVEVARQTGVELLVGTVSEVPIHRDAQIPRQPQHEKLASSNLQYRTLLSIPAYTWFLYLLPMTRRLFNDHIKLVNVLSVSFSRSSLDESKIGIVSTHWPTGWTGSPCWQSLTV